MRLTYANVVATLALVIAVGGGAAYAANTVFSADIVDGEVKTPDIASSAITEPKLANGSVASAKLKANVVTGDKVLDNTLKNADIDEPSIGLFDPARTALSPPSNSSLNTPVLIDTGTFTVAGTCSDTGVITSSLVIDGGVPQYAIQANGFDSESGVNLATTSGVNNLASLSTSAGLSGQKAVNFAATSNSGDFLHGTVHLANKAQGADCVFSVSAIGR